MFGQITGKSKANGELRPVEPTMAAGSESPRTCAVRVGSRQVGLTAIRFVPSFPDRLATPPTFTNLSRDPDDSLIVNGFLCRFLLTARLSARIWRSTGVVKFHHGTWLLEIKSVADWFLQRMEGSVQTEVGPMRPSELLSMVRRGDIKPETMLRKDDSAWFPAGDVGGLFEAAVKQEVQFFCPSCNQRVRKPPVTCGNCLRDLGLGEAREIKPEQFNNVDLKSAPQAEPEEQRSVQNWLKKKVARKQK